MKKLIYRPDSDIYYLSDEFGDPKGKTHILKYKVNSKDMPHIHFREYVVVYGSLTCPYCQKTFNLLKNKKLKFIFIEVDSEPFALFSKDVLINVLGDEIKNQTTIPIVFDKGLFIGGASESIKYFK